MVFMDRYFRKILRSFLFRKKKHPPAAKATRMLLRHHRDDAPGLLSGFSSLIKPAVPLGLVFGDPLVHVPFDVLLGFLAFIHARILFIDIIERDGKDFEELLCRRIFLDELLVGDDSNIGNHKAQLDGIGDRALDARHRHAINGGLLGFLGNDLGNVDPHHVFSGFKLENRPIGRPGIEEGKGLKYHAHVVQPEFDQLVRFHLRNVFPVHDHITGGGLDQPVEHAHNGGFSRAGQSHDHKDFALVDVEGGVVDPHREAGFFENSLFAETFFNQLQRLLRLENEDLEQIPTLSGIRFSADGKD